MTGSKEKTKEELIEELADLLSNATKDDPSAMQPGTVAHIEAGRPILFFIVACTALMAAAAIGAGVVLIYFGASGETETTLFGGTVKTSNVGIAAIFFGIVALVMVARRTLQAIERLGAIP